MADTFNIGDLARLTGTKSETIRYYESIGLLPQVARTAGNYRRYARPHLERLSFIRRGRDLGFSLDEVRELLRLSKSPELAISAKTMRVSEPGPA
jgi:DNA-binding transcriptional MerR regulator